MSQVRNAASPERIAVGAVVQISDGAVQTSGVSIAVRGQGGASGAGAGTIAYDNGIVEYTPTQAETDFTSFIVIAYKSGCIPVSQTIITVPALQTGDSFARLGAPAGASVSADIAALPTPLDAAGVRTAVGLASANLDTQLDDIDAALVAIDALLDTEIADILDYVGTTGVQVADKDGYRLSATGVDDIHDEAVDGSYTLRQLVRGLASALLGKLDGAATTTVTVRNLADSKNRISATVDADGNRSAVTLDLT